MLKTKSKLKKHLCIMCALFALLIGFSAVYSIGAFTTADAYGVDELELAQETEVLARQVLERQQGLKWSGLKHIEI